VGSDARLEQKLVTRNIVMAPGCETGIARRWHGSSGVLDWVALGGWIGSARRRRHEQWLLEQRSPGGVDCPARR